MSNLVTINPIISGGTAFVIPTPSKYSAVTATIVDSARNTAGEMIGNVIRYDVAKITMSWNFISIFDWSNMLKQFEIEFGGSFIRSVTFFNQTTASLSTRNMYVSDRNGGDAFLLYDDTNYPNGDTSLIGLPSGYQNASLSLIQV